MRDYVVVDSAQQPDYYRRLDHYRVQYRSLFEGHAEARFIDIAPLLLDMTELPADISDRVIMDAHRLGRTRPCISLLRSDRSLDDLAIHLRAYHLIGLPGQQRMILRWYDTRILPVWWDIMTSAQRRAFAYGVTEWRYFDRYGEERLLPLSEELIRATATEFAPLRLTESQYNALLTAAETDVVIAHLRDVIRDELRRVPMVALYPFVEAHLTAARQHGLHDLDAQAQYLLLALFTSGGFTQHPIVRERLMRPSIEHAEPFAAWMTQIPDEVWETGPPLWNSAESFGEQGQ